MQEEWYVLKEKRNACLKSLGAAAVVIALCAAVFIFGAFIVPISIIGAFLAMFLAYFLPSLPLLTLLHRSGRVRDLFAVSLDPMRDEEFSPKREFVSFGAGAADFFMRWVAYFLIIGFSLFFWTAFVICRLISAVYFQVKMWRRTD